MKTLLAMMAGVFLAAIAPAAAPAVTGTWSMTVDSPHGIMTTALTLKEDGGNVTGTFTSGGHLPDMNVTGTFANGTLKLEANESNSDQHSSITFTAKLLEDGTLSGSLSTEIGDMNWTAKRVDPKDKP
jgi:hypothetical protein